ncbi:MAG: J domain-containing protein [Actinobacteria bacterium]|nr:J domain-containing protein [Actinomycetota bacterium]
MTAEDEPSLYQRLGVTPAASTGEIRQAYRELVARLHPDRALDTSPADRAFAERRTREVNEAWRILRDPELRRRYDEERRLRGRPAGAADRPARTAVAPAGEHLGDDDLVDVLPPMTDLQAGLFRHLPWVAIAVVFLGIFVMTAYANHDARTGTSTGSTARQAQVGDCLDVPTGTSTTIVSCSGPYEFQVVGQVSSAADCPPESEARRLGTDTTFDCLAIP